MIWCPVGIQLVYAASRQFQATSWLVHALLHSADAHFAALNWYTLTAFADSSSLCALLHDT